MQQPLTNATEGASDGFLRYNEPSIVSLLTLISFFLLLSLAEWLSDTIFKAGLIGQIVVGMLYGLPVGNIMDMAWQETFVSLGYIGIILIIFEGGLTARIDLLKRNFFVSLCAAALGVLTPVSLCYLMLYLGLHYGPVETFIIGAALSSTSLGTTFVVMASTSKDVNLAHTRVGAVLVSAAVLDDISGLVMASVIHNLGGVADGNNPNIGWLIGRPIVASVAMGILTPLLATYLFSPIFRLYLEDHFARFRHRSNIVLMALVLCAFLAIASYAGTSVLYGAFLAGAFLSALPCNHPDAPFVVMSREHGETGEGKTPTFAHTFERYLLGARVYVLQPVFFASMGFAIPFKRLWTGEAVWKGVVFSALMVFGKMVAGLSISLWDLFNKRTSSSIKMRARLASSFAPAMLLSMAMVARGEIGLLIIQMGRNETPFLSEPAFITATWAIVLNTIVGPAAVGLLLRRKARLIAENENWGLQLPEMQICKTVSTVASGRSGRWTDRRYSRSLNLREASPPAVAVGCVGQGGGSSV